ncbi:MAG: phage tail protein [Pseudomonadota bacterium]|nr:phage tail protein [Pseudomonadota bacterium]
MALQYKFQPMWTNNYVGVHHYRVTLASGDYIIADEGILKIGGFQMDYDLIKFRMSLDRTERRYPGVLKAGDVTIERVVRGHDGMWRWYQTVRDGNVQRIDTKIELLGHNGAAVSTVTLKQCFPYKWEFPSLDAGSSSAAVEKITLAVEDILYESAVNSSLENETPV